MNEKNIPTCPHCGSKRFYIIVDTRSTTDFTLGYHPKTGKPDAFDLYREYGDTTEYQNIYCSECGRVVYKRKDLEAQGWPIPI